MPRHKRRPLRPERLHPYSRGFHDFLSLERPQWLSHAFNVLGYCHKQFDLEIELPHPSGTRPVGHLRLAAEPIQFWMNDGEELSISWWHWHTHAGLGAGAARTPEGDHREIVDRADEIMADRRVFIVRFDAGRWCGSTSVPVEELEEVLAEIAEDTEPDEVIVRSWTGALDRRIR